MHAMSCSAIPMPTIDLLPDTDAHDAGASNAETNVPQLTFGVEFEYVYICIEEDVPPREWDSYGRSVVRGVLSETLHAQCSSCRQRVPFKLPLLSTSRLNINDKNFTCWDVGPEALCVPKEEEDFLGADRDKYGFLSVEISSRVLHMSKYLEIPPQDGSSDHVHQISYVEEIKAVLSKLRREFCTFNGHQRRDNLFNSDVCGFHVHVGNFDKGFDLQTIKNVQCLDIACERLIDQIHAKQRINGTDLALRPLRWATHVVDGDREHCMDATTYNSPTSEKFLTRTYWARYRDSDQNDDEESTLRAMQRRIWERSVYPESKIDHKTDLADSWGRNDIDSWMTVVQLADDLRDLSHLATPRTKVSNVSIYHLLPKGMSHCKRTVEFRQHASTLQTAPVLAWIDFVVHAVHWCQGKGWESLKQFLGEDGVLRTAQATFLDLCQLVGCCKATMEHYTNVLSGEYSRHLRKYEYDQVRNYQYLGDPLVSFALASIRWERRNLYMRNVRRRVHQKLLYGGYGQFSREFLEAMATKIEDVSFQKRTLERITLGFESPILPTSSYGYFQCTFRDNDDESNPSDTDSRSIRSSSAESTSSASVWPRYLLSSARASPELTPVMPAQVLRSLPSQSVLSTLPERRRSNSLGLAPPTGITSQAIVEHEGDSSEDDRLRRSRRPSPVVYFGRTIRLPRSRKARSSICSC